MLFSAEIMSSVLKEPFFAATLPLPPGVNHSYRIIKVKTKSGGWAHTLAATLELEAFKSEAASAIKERAIVDRSVLDRVVLAYLVKKNKIALWASICFYFPTTWAKDVDGGIKHCIDVCCKELGLNDNLITDLFARKRVDKNDPRVEVQLFLAEVEKRILDGTKLCQKNNRIPPASSA